MFLIYIAAPFTADTPEGIQKNIDYATQLAAEVDDAGNGEVYAFCPHPMGFAINQKMKTHKEANDDFWYKGDIALLKRCDAAIFGGDWGHSTGCCMEFDFTQTDMDIPVTSVDLWKDTKSAVEFLVTEVKKWSKK